MEILSAQEFLKYPAEEFMARIVAASAPILVKGLLQTCMPEEDLVSVVECLGRVVALWRLVIALLNESLDAWRVAGRLMNR